MSFDDEKAKIRRNLVVFCSVYLAGAYLGISAQETLNAYFSTKGGIEIPVEKVVVVSLIVFLYLSWRWFTSDEQREQFGAMTGGLRGRFDSLINDWAIKRMDSSSFDRHFEFLEEVEREKYDRWIKFIEKNLNATPNFKSNVNSYKRKGKSGNWLMHLEWFGPKGVREQDQLVNFKVNLQWWLAIILLIRASFFVLSRSAFWEWVPPAILSLATFLLISYRVINIYLG